MKRGLLAAALLTLTLLGASAVAQTLPDVDCFSPGLVRVSDALNAGAALSVEAQFSAENAHYARDISVLQAMLSGTTFAYDGDGSSDRLRITREERTLFDASLARGEQGAALTVGGKTYAVADGLFGVSGGLEAYDGALPLEAMLAFPLFERVPLASIAGWLESLGEGDALAGGVTVSRAFTVKRTMSDDGERLTRIDIDGAVALGDEKPYEVTGKLYQPGGRAPKDSFEITAKQDGDNHFTLTYSSTRSSEITRRDQAGKNSVQTTLRSDGYLAGNHIESRLTVRLTNNWTANDEGLAEKITVSANLGHTDKTPGRKMIRLNDLSASASATLQLSTSEEMEGAIAFSNEAKLSVVMDGNDFLGGTMRSSVTVGGDAQAYAAGAESDEIAGTLGTQADVDALMGETVQKLATELYLQLGDSALKTIESGL